MTATRNFNAYNEDMEINLLDDITDPDVEARLYSEIYYSNDTYPDLPESLELPPSVPAPSTPSDSTSRDSPQWSLDPQPGQSNSPSLGAPQEIPQYSKRKKHRPLIDGLLEVPCPPKTRRPYPIDNRPSKYPRNDSPRGNHKRREYNPSQKSRRSREHPWREKTNRDGEDLMEEEGEPDSTSLTAIDEAMTPGKETTPKTPELVQNTLKTPEETQGTSNDSATGPEVRKDDEEAEVNSKYKVERKKLKIKSTLVAEISDSDDSILEVPVPPKPVPPLIRLQDSDDSSSEEEVVKDTLERASCFVQDSSSDSSSSSSPVIIEDSEDTMDSSAATETTNLIINCSSIEKGVSSLAGIKRMREREGKKAGGQSDEESMTESEAMNWGSLEGEVEKSQGETLKQLWQEFSDERDPRRNLLNESGSSEKPIDDTSRIPLERTVEARAEEAGNRRERKDDAIPRAGKRNLERRAEGETSRKKKRQKVNQDREMSFEEYLLQPMPQQLIDFYNEPRGGDILRDIREIQNDMPKNPSRWMILDADMYPVQRNRKNVCAICQQEGHIRSRCPERPRAPTCHICGKVGHSEPRCPENKKCITCGKRYSTCRRTCENCNRLRCSLCNGRGHTLASCPDNWRKYHQTTTGESVSITSIRLAVMKPPSQLVCCHCIQRGHHVSTCQDLHSDDTEPIFEIIDIESVDDCDDDIEILTPETNTKSLTDEVVVLSDDSDRVSHKESDCESESSLISVDGGSKCENQVNFSDNDSDIEIIPYVKPAIPTFSISDEDDDDDVNRSSVKSDVGNAETNPGSSTSNYYDPSCPTLDSSSSSEGEIDVEFLDEDINVEDLSDKSEGKNESNEVIDVGVEENFVVKIIAVSQIEENDREEGDQAVVVDLLNQIIKDAEMLNESERLDVEGNVGGERISVEQNISLDVTDLREAVMLSQNEILDVEGTAEEDISLEVSQLREEGMLSETEILDIEETAEGERISMEQDRPSENLEAQDLVMLNEKVIVVAEGNAGNERILREQHVLAETSELQVHVISNTTEMDERVSIEKNVLSEISEPQDQEMLEINVISEERTTEDDRISMEQNYELGISDQTLLNKHQILNVEGTGEDGTIVIEENARFDETVPPDVKIYNDQVERETDEVIKNSKVDCETLPSLVKRPGASDDDGDESDDSGSIPYVKQERLEAQKDLTSNKPTNTFDVVLKREPKVEPPDL